MAHIFGFRSERAVPSALCFVLLTASLGAWHQLGGGGGRKTSIVFPAAAAPAAVVESSVVRTSSTSSMLSRSSRPRPACPACPTAEPCPDPSAVQRTTLDSSSLKPQASSRASLKPREGTLRRSVHDQVGTLQADGDLPVGTLQADGDLPAAEKHLPVAECALVTERVRELVAENEKLHLEIVGLKSSRQDVRFNLSHSLKPSATEDEDEVTPLNDQRQVADQLEVEGTATKGGTAGGTTSSTPDVAVQRQREFSSRNGGGGAVVDGTKYKGSKAGEEGGEDGHRESSSVQKELLLRAADLPALENKIRTSETSKTKTKTRAEAEAEAAAAREGSFLGRAATELQLHQLGTPSEQWWGMEHFAPIAHAAAAANAGREPCVVVEIGAHAGTLALLAGKMGCEVYAFEADAAHRRRYELNAALNAHASPGGCRGKVTYTLGAVGQTAGSRVDEVVPPGTRVTLLKVDIDSVDMFALRGAEGLFLGGAAGIDAAAASPGDGAGTEEARGGGVDFVNLEFSPAKHRAATRTRPEQYLEEVHRRGFDIFLLDCYFDENKTLPAAGLRQRCLAKVREDYDPGGAAGRGFVEVSESRLLLRCVMEGLGCDLHDAAALVAGQLVPPSDFAAFAAAVTEVDVLCVRRNVKKIFVSSTAKSTT